ncbi:hypothetical protein B0J18DRAFT_100942 [Chaetomium sp. MPI-SDFR-AT-0129]|nr:hypothetical protein B0J18DRAFT_100942 [Chaetomium sp. MPI-SDFR-AT-0129]
MSLSHSPPIEQFLTAPKLQRAFRRARKGVRKRTALLNRAEGRSLWSPWSKRPILPRHVLAKRPLATFLFLVFHPTLGAGHPLDNIFAVSRPLREMSHLISSPCPAPISESGAIALVQTAPDSSSAAPRFFVMSTPEHVPRTHQKSRIIKLRL